MTDIPPAGCLRAEAAKRVARLSESLCTARNRRLGESCDRWTKQQLATRFEGISRTLSAASFPLNPPIVQLLADLTDTELMTLTADGSIGASSIDLPGDFTSHAIGQQAELSQSLQIGGRPYLVGVFQRRGSVNDRVDRVVVLFDESQLREARLRAAGLPLATGLSTVFLLTSVTLLLAGRLIGRLSRLGLKVDQIAEGQLRDRHSCRCA